MLHPKVVIIKGRNQRSMQENSITIATRIQACSCVFPIPPIILVLPGPRPSRGNPPEPHPNPYIGRTSAPFHFLCALQHDHRFRPLPCSEHHVHYHGKSSNYGPCRLLEFGHPTGSTFGYISISEFLHDAIIARCRHGSVHSDMADYSRMLLDSEHHWRFLPL